jgi:hypothetical protein
MRREITGNNRHWLLLFFKILVIDTVSVILT